MVRTSPVSDAAHRTVHARRKQRERQQRCQDVLDVARDLFVRRGYDGATMADIAAQADFAVGTLYQLFPSKEAILRALLEAQIDRLLGVLRESAGASGGAPARLTRVVRAHLAFFLEHRDVLRLTLSAWSGSDFTVRRDLGARLDRKHREHLAVLVPLFEQGMREGVFASRPAVRVAVALTGMLNALIRRWLREPTIDLLAEGDATLEMLLCGIQANGSRAGKRRAPASTG